MMIFIKLFAYIFFAYGITTIMVFGRGPFGICEKIRSLADSISEGLGQLFHCPMCFSTWVGLMLSLLDVLAFKNMAFTPFSIVFSGLSGVWVGILVVLLDAFCTSGIVWLLYEFEQALQRHCAGYGEEEIIYEDEENGDK